MMKTSCQKTIYVWHDRQVNALVSNNLRRLWQVLMLFINTIITFPIINIKIECNARRAFSNKIFKPGASSGYIVVSMNTLFWLELSVESLTGILPVNPFIPICTLSLPPEKIRKRYSFLMFSGSRERVHRERMC